MAEKCISSFANTSVDAIKPSAAINCHGNIIVDSTTKIRPNSIKIIDDSSEVSLDATNDSTTFERNLLETCNLLIGVGDGDGDDNNTSLHIIKINSKENTTDNIDDDDNNDDGSRFGSSEDQHVNNTIFLETPVIEDNVCLVGDNNNFEKVQVKQKRISKEFLSTDEDNDDDDDVDDKTINEIRNTSCSPPSIAIKLITSISSRTIPATTTTPVRSSIEEEVNGNSFLHSVQEFDDEEKEKNNNVNFIPVDSLSSRDFLEYETNSLCSNLVHCLKDEDSQLLMIEGEKNEKPTTSSSSNIDCFSKSKKYQITLKKIEEEMCGGDVDNNGVVSGSGITSSESTVSYYDNDVQSMDTIERTDFEHEQRITGGILIRTCSLVNSDNKLNLDIIKKYNNSNDTERNVSSDSKFIAAQRAMQHQMTPTSSRNCPTRLIKSTAKINLSATIDCLTEQLLENEQKIIKLINLQPSTSKNQQNVIIQQSSSSTVACLATPIKSTCSLDGVIIVETKCNNKKTNSQTTTKQENIFISSNSNDSLSSDKSYSTSSNHSLPNISSKFASEKIQSCSANEVKYLLDKSHSDSIKMKSSTQNNNNLSNIANLYAETGVASTSKKYLIDPDDDDDNEDEDQSFCCSEQQYKQKKECNNNSNNEDESCNDDLNNIKNLNKSKFTKSVRLNKKVLDIKDSCNYKKVEYKTSSSTATQNGSSTVVSPATVTKPPTFGNEQQTKPVLNNQNFDENQFLERGNELNQLRRQQLHAHDNEFDDETWADCEEGSDEEICTCHNNMPIDFPNQTGNNEDDLPSKDVDLSSYIQMVSISDDMFLQHNNMSPDFLKVQRKRKLNEISSNVGSGCVVRATYDQDSNSFSETPSNSRKRLALDCTSTPRSSQQQHLSNSGNISSGTIYLSPTIPSNAQILRTSRSIIPTKDNPPPELQNWLCQFQMWSHAERLLAVDRLIEHCEPQQVRHMMKVIEPQFQRDFISLLPRELALQVLSYLDPKDLLRATQTCRSWRFLCDDNLLWKEKCKTAQILTEPASDRPKRGRAGNMPLISSPWKAAYMRQHIIELNWRTRPIRDPKILKGHDDHVITCLQFYGNRIVSGSDDNTLKVWSAVSGKCLRTLVGHTGGVWSSQMAGNVIISGSTDRTLKVWNMETGQCIHTLLGHTSTVRCMHLHGKKVVSGSRDATLRVWDIEQGTCLHVLVGHLAAVRCVQYDGKLIVSGAYDYMVKIWHPERQECLHTLQGHTNRVYSLQFDGIHVVSGSLDTSIRVWDAETGNSKHTLMGHQSLTSGMELRSNILVSGNADSTVKVWDITTGQCLQTLSGPNKHQSAVTCLQFNSRFVITSSDDGTVKLWDVKTGEFIRNLVALDSGGSGGVVWRIRANDTKLICAVGSRNGTEETKLMVLDFDVEGACVKCS